VFGYLQMSEQVHWGHLISSHIFPVTDIKYASTFFFFFFFFRFLKDDKTIGLSIQNFFILMSTREQTENKY